MISLIFILIRKIMSCRNCKKKKLKKIINIGKQCISSVFPKKINHKLKEYSLNLYKCTHCELVQFKNTPLQKTCTV